MKGSSILSKILTNKIVLMIVLFLALFHIVGYIAVGQYTLLAYFIVLSLLVRYFSKNMILVLGIPLLILHLLFLQPFMTRLMEGMENNASTSTSTYISKTGNENKEIKAANTREQKKKDSPQKDGFHTEERGDSGVGKKKKYNVDYASTIEDAYDNLNNLLGSDGIQRLTNDTQHLVKQQMQLAEAMKNIGPMMKTLTPMVEQLKGMMGDNNLSGMMDMAKKMTSK